MIEIDLCDPKLYEAWSEESLKTHIQRLREILRVKSGAKPDPTPAHLKLFQMTTSNFLGSGMSMLEYIQARSIVDFQTTFVTQERSEKKRRLDLIVRLSAELVRIRETSRFSTAFGEAAIEAVIDGDWKHVRDLEGDLTFKDEDPETVRMYGPLWAKFRELCREAFDTRPDKPKPTLSDC